MIDLLPIVLRAHTERAKPQQKTTRRGLSRNRFPRWGTLVLVLDTETTIDSSQKLMFGSARLCKWRDGNTMECLREFLFHADDLEGSNPEGFAELKRYAREHQRENRLELMSRRNFLDRVLWLAFKSKTLIVGFNLPFDLSRLAIHWTEARDGYANGFSFVLWDTIDEKTKKRHENRFRPRLRIKHLDSKRALMSVASSGKDKIRVKLLDLRTLSFALTDKGYTLASACDAFSVEHGKETAKQHGQIDEAYIGYNRRDVLATQELLGKLRQEYDRHPIDLDPVNALSSASIAKAYIRVTGVVPPREKFHDTPIEITAAAMMAYYGGRAECRIRKLVRPVVYCDFLSMYTTVHTLIDMRSVQTAESLSFVDATDEVQEFLEYATRDELHKPETWKRLKFFALIEPSDDILPVRAPYAEGSRAFNIGVNPLTFAGTIPFAGPDLVAAKILSGKSPRVIRAWRLAPSGKQKGLRSTRLRGEIDINPAEDDFFRRIIEQRKALSHRKGLSQEQRERLSQSLKTIANSGSYGINAQLDRIDVTEKEKLIVYGLDGPFIASANAVERPGEFYCPLIAALITAGARLMLALLEIQVAAAGGKYVFCDTDSMAITLPLPDVQEIVKRFESLNPYDRSVVPESILKIEAENFDPETGAPLQLFCYAIAAKRYALFNLDRRNRFTIRKFTEHGLGHLLNPIDPAEESPDWIRRIWELIIAEALGQKIEMPQWMNRPAISRIGATTPDLVRRLHDRRKRRSYAEQIKPMNFLLSAQVAPLQIPGTTHRKSFQLIAPFNPDPRHWGSMVWTDYYSGEEYAITTVGNSGSRVIRVKSYADIFEEFRNHPEPKSLGPDGEPCGRATVGELSRRPVFGVYSIYIGKESNRYEEVEQGTVHDWDEVRSEYEDPNHGPWQKVVLPVLKMMNAADVARDADISEGHVRRLRNGRQRPLSELRELLTKLAANYSRAQVGEHAPADDLAACGSFLHGIQNAMSG